MAGLQSFSSSRIERQTRMEKCCTHSILRLDSHLFRRGKRWGGIEGGQTSLWEEWWGSRHWRWSDLCRDLPARGFRSYRGFRTCSEWEVSVFPPRGEAIQYNTYSQSMRFMVPSWFFIGLAMKPNGWSFLQDFLSSDRRAWAIPDISSLVGVSGTGLAWWKLCLGNFWNAGIERFERGYC